MSLDRSGAAESPLVVVTEPMFDRDDLYIGYRIKIERPAGDPVVVDVTGASSRFADKGQWSDKVVGKVRAADDHVAPSEGENFPGGYAASADQAARYAAHSRNIATTSPQGNREL